MTSMRLPLLAVPVLMFASLLAGDAPPLAARSVHLSYLAPSDAPGYVAFYNECTVEQSVEGSYFQACGFAGGYFGIQDLGPKGKIAIFSVWDQTQGDDPKAVDEKDRVEMLFVGENVRAQRFGGEGTGAQSFFDYDWQVGQTIRFYVEAKPEPNKTTYAAYIQLPDEKTWKHLASFRTRGGKPMSHLYAFIEDFRRDTKSANDIRRALFGNTSVCDEQGNWLTIRKATFTASGAEWEAKETIDAGAIGPAFYLQTGGATRMTSPLGSILSLDTN